MENYFANSRCYDAESLFSLISNSPYALERIADGIDDEGASAAIYYVADCLKAQLEGLREIILPHAEHEDNEADIETE